MSHRGMTGANDGFNHHEDRSSSHFSFSERLGMKRDTELRENELLAQDEGARDSLFMCRFTFRKHSMFTLP